MEIGILLKWENWVIHLTEHGRLISILNFTLLIDRNIVGNNFNVDVSAYFNSNVAFLFYLNEYDTYQRNRIAPQTINVSISDGAKYNINTNNTTTKRI